MIKFNFEEQDERTWAEKAEDSYESARKAWRGRYDRPQIALRDWSEFERLQKRKGVISRAEIRESVEEDLSLSAGDETVEFDLPKMIKEHFPDAYAIGCAAFAQTRVSRIVIPEGIQVIGPFAFYGCYELREVELPKSLIAISDDAFGNCNHLAAPNLKRCRKLKKIGNRAFASCSSHRFGALTFPRSLSEIGLFAFRTCSHLEVVRFNSQLNKLGYGAFNECISLGKVKNLPTRRLKLEEEEPDKATSNCTPLDIALARRFHKTPYARRNGFNDYAPRFRNTELEAFEYPF